MGKKKKKKGKKKKKKKKKKEKKEKKMKKKEKKKKNKKREKIKKNREGELRHCLVPSPGCDKEEGLSLEVKNGGVIHCEEVNGSSQ